jgi:hypothetical protein
MVFMLIVYVVPNGVAGLIESGWTKMSAKEAAP